MAPRLEGLEGKLGVSVMRNNDFNILFTADHARQRYSGWYKVSVVIGVFWAIPFPGEVVEHESMYQSN